MGWASFSTVTVPFLFSLIFLAASLIILMLYSQIIMAKIIVFVVRRFLLPRSKGSNKEKGRPLYHFELSSIQFAPLRMRIFFRGLQLVTEDMSISVMDGYVTFAYWKLGRPMLWGEQWETIQKRLVTSALKSIDRYDNNVNIVDAKARGDMPGSDDCINPKVDGSDWVDNSISSRIAQLLSFGVPEKSPREAALSSVLFRNNQKLVRKDCYRGQTCRVLLPQMRTHRRVPKLRGTILCLIGVGDSRELECILRPARPTSEGDVDGSKGAEPKMSVQPSDERNGNEVDDKEKMKRDELVKAAVSDGLVVVRIPAVRLISVKRRIDFSKVHIVGASDPETIKRQIFASQSNSSVPVDGPVPFIPTTLPLPDVMPHERSSSHSSAPMPTNPTVDPSSNVVPDDTVDIAVPLADVEVPFKEGLLSLHLNGLTVSIYNNVGKYEELERLMNETEENLKQCVGENKYNINGKGNTTQSSCCEEYTNIPGKAVEESKKKRNSYISNKMDMRRRSFSLRGRRPFSLRAFNRREVKKKHHNTAGNNATEVEYRKDIICDGFSECQGGSDTSDVSMENRGEYSPTEKPDSLRSEIPTARNEERCHDTEAIKSGNNNTVQSITGDEGQYNDLDYEGRYIREDEGEEMKCMDASGRSVKTASYTTTSSSSKTKVEAETGKGTLQSFLYSFLLPLASQIEVQVYTGNITAGILPPTGTQATQSSHPYFLYFGFTRADSTYYITDDGVSFLDFGRHVFDTTFEAVQCHWHSNMYDSLKGSTSGEDGRRSKRSKKKEKLSSKSAAKSNPDMAMPQSTKYDGNSGDNETPDNDNMMSSSSSSSYDDIAKWPGRRGKPSAARLRMNVRLMMKGHTGLNKRRKDDNVPSQTEGRRNINNAKKTTGNENSGFWLFRHLPGWAYISSGERDRHQLYSEEDYEGYISEGIDESNIGDGVDERDKTTEGSHEEDVCLDSLQVFDDDAGNKELIGNRQVLKRLLKAQARLMERDKQRYNNTNFNRYRKRRLDSIAAALLKIKSDERIQRQNKQLFLKHQQMLKDPSSSMLPPSNGPMTDTDLVSTFGVILDSKSAANVRIRYYWDIPGYCLEKKQLSLDNEATTSNNVPFNTYSPLSKCSYIASIERALLLHQMREGRRSKMNHNQEERYNEYRDVQSPVSPNTNFPSVASHMYSPKEGNVDTECEIYNNAFAAVEVQRILQEDMKLPRMGLEIYIDTDELSYGSWSEYSRQQLFRYIFPQTFQPLRNLVAAAGGECFPVLITEHNVIDPTYCQKNKKKSAKKKKKNAKKRRHQSLTTSANVRNPSLAEAGISTCLRDFGCFEFMLELTRDTKIVMPFKHKSDHVSLPLALEDSGKVGSILLSVGKGSYMSITSPFGFTESEYDRTAIGETYVKLVAPTVQTSLFAGGSTFLTCAGSCEIFLDIQYQEFWNMLQIWDTVVLFKGTPQIWWFSDMQRFFNDFLTDWGNVGALYHGSALDPKHSAEFYGAGIDNSDEETMKNSRKSKMEFCSSEDEVSFFYSDDGPYAKMNDIQRKLYDHDQCSLKRTSRSPRSIAQRNFLFIPSVRNIEVLFEGTPEGSMTDSKWPYAYSSFSTTFDGILRGSTVGSVNDKDSLLPPWTRSSIGTAIYINANKDNIMYSDDPTDLTANTSLIFAVKKGCIKIHMPFTQYRNELLEHGETKKLSYQTTDYDLTFEDIELYYNTPEGWTTTSGEIKKGNKNADENGTSDTENPQDFEECHEVEDSHWPVYIPSAICHNISLSGTYTTEMEPLPLSTSQKSLSSNNVKSYVKKHIPNQNQSFIGGVNRLGDHTDRPPHHRRNQMSGSFGNDYRFDTIDDGEIISGASFRGSHAREMSGSSATSTTKHDIGGSFAELGHNQGPQLVQNPVPNLVSSVTVNIDINSVKMTATSPFIYSSAVAIMNLFSDQCGTIEPADFFSMTAACHAQDFTLGKSIGKCPTADELLKDIGKYSAYNLKNLFERFLARNDLAKSRSAMTTFVTLKAKDIDVVVSAGYDPIVHCHVIPLVPLYRNRGQYVSSVENVIRGGFTPSSKFNLNEAQNSPDTNDEFNMREHIFTNINTDDDDVESGDLYENYKSTNNLKKLNGSRKFSSRVGASSETTMQYPFIGAHTHEFAFSIHINRDSTNIQVDITPIVMKLPAEASLKEHRSNTLNRNCNNTSNSHSDTSSQRMRDETMASFGYRSLGGIGILRNSDDEERDLQEYIFPIICPKGTKVVTSHNMMSWLSGPCPHAFSQGYDTTFTYGDTSADYDGCTDRREQNVLFNITRYDSNQYIALGSISINRMRLTSHKELEKEPYYGTNAATIDGITIHVDDLSDQLQNLVQLGSELVRQWKQASSHSGIVKEMLKASEELIYNGTLGEGNTLISTPKSLKCPSPKEVYRMLHHFFVLYYKRDRKMRHISVKKDIEKPSEISSRKPMDLPADSEGDNVHLHNITPSRKEEVEGMKEIRKESECYILTVEREGSDEASDFKLVEPQHPEHQEESTFTKKASDISDHRRRRLEGLSAMSDCALSSAEKGSVQKSATSHVGSIQREPTKLTSALLLYRLNKKLRACGRRGRCQASLVASRSLAWRRSVVHTFDPILTSLAKGCQHPRVSQSFNATDYSLDVLEEVVLKNNRRQQYQERKALFTAALELAWLNHIVQDEDRYLFRKMLCDMEKLNNLSNEYAVKTTRVNVSFVTVALRVELHDPNSRGVIRGNPSATKYFHSHRGDDLKTNRENIRRETHPLSIGHVLPEKGVRPLAPYLYLLLPRGLHVATSTMKDASSSSRISVAVNDINMRVLAPQKESQCILERWQVTRMERKSHQRQNMFYQSLPAVQRKMSYCDRSERPMNKIRQGYVTNSLSDASGVGSGVAQMTRKDMTPIQESMPHLHHNIPSLQEHAHYTAPTITQRLSTMREVGCLTTSLVCRIVVSAVSPIGISNRQDSQPGIIGGLVSQLLAQKEYIHLRDWRRLVRFDDNAEYNPKITQGWCAPMTPLQQSQHLQSAGCMPPLGHQHQTLQNTPNTYRNFISVQKNQQPFNQRQTQHQPFLHHQKRQSTPPPLIEIMFPKKEQEETYVPHPLTSSTSIQQHHSTKSDLRPSTQVSCSSRVESGGGIVSSTESNQAFSSKCSFKSTHSESAPILLEEPLLSPGPTCDGTDVASVSSVKNEEHGYVERETREVVEGDSVTEKVNTTCLNNGIIKSLGSFVSDGDKRSRSQTCAKNNNKSSISMKSCDGVDHDDCNADRAAEDYTNNTSFHNSVCTEVKEAEIYSSVCESESDRFYSMADTLDHSAFLTNASEALFTCMSDVSDDWIPGGVDERMASDDQFADAVTCQSNNFSNSFGDQKNDVSVFGGEVSTNGSVIGKKTGDSSLATTTKVNMKGLSHSKQLNEGDIDINDSTIRKKGFNGTSVREGNERRDHYEERDRGVERVSDTDDYLSFTREVAEKRSFHQINHKKRISSSGDYVGSDGIVLHNSGSLDANQINKSGASNKGDACSVVINEKLGGHRRKSNHSRNISGHSDTRIRDPSSQHGEPNDGRKRTEGSKETYAEIYQQDLVNEEYTTQQMLLNTRCSASCILENSLHPVVLRTHAPYTDIRGMYDSHLYPTLRLPQTDFFPVLPGKQNIFIGERKQTNEQMRSRGSANTHNSPFDKKKSRDSNNDRWKDVEKNSTAATGHIVRDIFNIMQNDDYLFYDMLLYSPVGAAQRDLLQHAVLRFDTPESLPSESIPTPWASHNIISSHSPYSIVHGGNVTNFASNNLRTTNTSTTHLDLTKNTHCMLSVDAIAVLTESVFQGFEALTQLLPVLSPPKSNIKKSKTAYELNPTTRNVSITSDIPLGRDINSRGSLPPSTVTLRRRSTTESSPRIITSQKMSPNGGNRNITSPAPDKESILSFSSASIEVKFLLLTPSFEKSLSTQISPEAIGRTKIPLQLNACHLVAQGVKIICRKAVQQQNSNRGCSDHISDMKTNFTWSVGSEMTTIYCHRIADDALGYTKLRAIISPCSPTPQSSTLPVSKGKLLVTIPSVNGIEVEPPLIIGAEGLRQEKYRHNIHQFPLVGMMYITNMIARGREETKTHILVTAMSLKFDKCNIHLSVPLIFVLEGLKMVIGDHYRRCESFEVTDICEKALKSEKMQQNDFIGTTEMKADNPSLLVDVSEDVSHEEITAADTCPLTPISILLPTANTVSAVEGGDCKSIQPSILATVTPKLDSPKHNETNIKKWLKPNYSQCVQGVIVGKSFVVSLWDFSAQSQNLKQFNFLERSSEDKNIINEGAGVTSYIVESDGTSRDPQLARRRSSGLRDTIKDPVTSPECMIDLKGLAGTSSQLSSLRNHGSISSGGIYFEDYVISSPQLAATMKFENPAIHFTTKRINMSLLPNSIHAVGELSNFKSWVWPCVSDCANQARDVVEHYKLKPIESKVNSISADNQSSRSLSTDSKINPSNSQTIPCEEPLSEQTLFVTSFSLRQVVMHFLFSESNFLKLTTDELSAFASNATIPSKVPVSGGKNGSTFIPMSRNMDPLVAQKSAAMISRANARYERDQIRMSEATSQSNNRRASTEQDNTHSGNTFSYHNKPKGPSSAGDASNPDLYSHQRLTLCASVFFTSLVLDYFADQSMMASLVQTGGKQSNRKYSAGLSETNKYSPENDKIRSCVEPSAGETLVGANARDKTNVKKEEMDGGSKHNPTTDLDKTGRSMMLDPSLLDNNTMNMNRMGRKSFNDERPFIYPNPHSHPRCYLSAPDYESRQFEANPNFNYHHVHQASISAVEKKTYTYINDEGDDICLLHASSLNGSRVVYFNIRDFYTTVHLTEATPKRNNEKKDHSTGNVTNKSQTPLSSSLSHDIQDQFYFHLSVGTAGIKIPFKPHMFNVVQPQLASFIQEWRRAIKNMIYPTEDNISCNFDCPPPSMSQPCQFSQYQNPQNNKSHTERRTRSDVPGLFPRDGTVNSDHITGTQSQGHVILTHQQRKRFIITTLLLKNLYIAVGLPKRDKVIVRLPKTTTYILNALHDDSTVVKLHCHPSYIVSVISKDPHSFESHLSPSEEHHNMSRCTTTSKCQDSVSREKEENIDDNLFSTGAVHAVRESSSVTSRKFSNEFTTRVSNVIEGEIEEIDEKFSNSVTYDALERSGPELIPHVRRASGNVRGSSLTFDVRGRSGIINERQGEHNNAAYDLSSVVQRGVYPGSSDSNPRRNENHHHINAQEHQIILPQFYVTIEQDKEQMNASLMVDTFRTSVSPVIVSSLVLLYEVITKELLAMLNDQVIVHEDNDDYYQSEKRNSGSGTSPGVPRSHAAVSLERSNATRASPEEDCGNVDKGDPVIGSFALLPPDTQPKSPEWKRNIKISGLVRGCHIVFASAVCATTFEVKGVVISAVSKITSNTANQTKFQIPYTQMPREAQGSTHLLTRSQSTSYVWRIGVPHVSVAVSDREDYDRFVAYSTILEDRKTHQIKSSNKFSHPHRPIRTPVGTPLYTTCTKGYLWGSIKTAFSCTYSTETARDDELSMTQVGVEIGSPSYRSKIHSRSKRSASFVDLRRGSNNDSDTASMNDDGTPTESVDMRWGSMSLGDSVDSIGRHTRTNSVTSNDGVLYRNDMLYTKEDLETDNKEGISTLNSSSFPRKSTSLTCVKCFFDVSKIEVTFKSGLNQQIHMIKREIRHNLDINRISMDDLTRLRRQLLDTREYKRMVRRARMVIAKNNSTSFSHVVRKSCGEDRVSKTSKEETGGVQPPKKTMSSNDENDVLFRSADISLSSAIKDCTSDTTKKNQIKELAMQANEDAKTIIISACVRDICFIMPFGNSSYSKTMLGDPCIYGNCACNKIEHSRLSNKVPYIPRLSNSLLNHSMRCIAATYYIPVNVVKIAFKEIKGSLLIERLCEDDNTLPASQESEGPIEVSPNLSCSNEVLIRRESGSSGCPKRGKGDNGGENLTTTKTTASPANASSKVDIRNFFNHSKKCTGIIGVQKVLAYMANNGKSVNNITSKTLVPMLSGDILLGGGGFLHVGSDTTMAKSERQTVTHGRHVHIKDRDDHKEAPTSLLFDRSAFTSSTSSSGTFSSPSSPFFSYLEREYHKSTNKVLIHSIHCPIRCDFSDKENKQTVKATLEASAPEGRANSQLISFIEVLHDEFRTTVELPDSVIFGMSARGSDHFPLPQAMNASSTTKRRVSNTKTTLLKDIPVESPWVYSSLGAVASSVEFQVTATMHKGCIELYSATPVPLTGLSSPAGTRKRDDSPGAATRDSNAPTGKRGVTFGDTSGEAADGAAVTPNSRSRRVGAMMESLLMTFPTPALNTNVLMKVSPKDVSVVMTVDVDWGTIEIRFPMNSMVSEVQSWRVYFGQMRSLSSELIMKIVSTIENELETKSGASSSVAAPTKIMEVLTYIEHTTIIDALLPIPRCLASRAATARQQHAINNCLGSSSISHQQGDEGAYVTEMENCQRAFIDSSLSLSSHSDENYDTPFFRRSKEQKLIDVQFALSISTLKITFSANPISSTYFTLLLDDQDSLSLIINYMSPVIPSHERIFSLVREGEYDLPTKMGGSTADVTVGLSSTLPLPVLRRRICVAVTVKNIAVECESKSEMQCIEANLSTLRCTFSREDRTMYEMIRKNQYNGGTNKAIKLYNNNYPAPENCRYSPSNMSIKASTKTNQQLVIEALSPEHIGMETRAALSGDTVNGSRASWGGNTYKMRHRNNAKSINKAGSNNKNSGANSGEYDPKSAFDGILRVQYFDQFFTMAQLLITKAEEGYSVYKSLAGPSILGSVVEDNADITHSTWSLRSLTQISNHIATRCVDKTTHIIFLFDPITCGVDLGIGNRHNIGIGKIKCKITETTLDPVAGHLLQQISLSISRFSVVSQGQLTGYVVMDSGIALRGLRISQGERDIMPFGPSNGQHQGCAGEVSTANDVLAALQKLDTLNTGQNHKNKKPDAVPRSKKYCQEVDYNRKIKSKNSVQNENHESILLYTTRENIQENLKFQQMQQILQQHPAYHEALRKLGSSYRIITPDLRTHLLVAEIPSAAVSFQERQIKDVCLMEVLKFSFSIRNSVDTAIRSPYYVEKHNKAHTSSSTAQTSFQTTHLQEDLGKKLNRRRTTGNASYEIEVVSEKFLMGITAESNICMRRALIGAKEVVVNQKRSAFENVVEKLHLGGDKEEGVDEENRQTLPGSIRGLFFPDFSDNTDVDDRNEDRSLSTGSSTPPHQRNDSDSVNYGYNTDNRGTLGKFKNVSNAGSEMWRLLPLPGQVSIQLWNNIILLGALDSGIGMLHPTTLAVLNKFAESSSISPTSSILGNYIGTSSGRAGGIVLSIPAISIVHGQAIANALSAPCDISNEEIRLLRGVGRLTGLFKRALIRANALSPTESHEDEILSPLVVDDAFDNLDNRGALENRMTEESNETVTTAVREQRGTSSDESPTTSTSPTSTSSFSITPSAVRCTKIVKGVLEIIVDSWNLRRSGGSCTLLGCNARNVIELYVEHPLVEALEIVIPEPPFFKEHLRFQQPPHLHNSFLYTTDLSMAASVGYSFAFSQDQPWTGAPEFDDLASLTNIIRSFSSSNVNTNVKANADRVSTNPQSQIYTVKSRGREGGKSTFISPVGAYLVSAHMHPISLTQQPIIGSPPHIPPVLAWANGVVEVLWLYRPLRPTRFDPTISEVRFSIQGLLSAAGITASVPADIDTPVHRRHNEGNLDSKDNQTSTQGNTRQYVSGSHSNNKQKSIINGVSYEYHCVDDEDEEDDENYKSNESTNNLSSNNEFGNLPEKRTNERGGIYNNNDTNDWSSVNTVVTLSSNSQQGDNEDMPNEHNRANVPCKRRNNDIDVNADVSLRTSSAALSKPIVDLSPPFSTIKKTKSGGMQREECQQRSKKRFRHKQVMEAQLSKRQVLERQTLPVKMINKICVPLGNAIDSIGEMMYS